MDLSRNDTLSALASDAALERTAFLVEATEQLRKFLDRNLDRDGDGDLLQLHEPLAADADRLPLDVDCDPVADLVLCVVVERQFQPQLFGPVENRQGNRMMEFTLGGRRELEDPLAREAGGRDDPANLRALVGQRSCLVEEHRIDRAHLL